MTAQSLDAWLDHELSEEEIDGLIANRDTPYTLQLADEVVTITGNWLLFNWPWWRVLHRHGLPVCRRHLMVDRLPDKKTQQAIQDLILAEVRIGRPTALRWIGYDLVGAINWQYNVYVRHLGRFHLTLDGFAVAEALAEPQIQEGLHLDVAEAEVSGIHAVEQVMRDTYARGLKTLKRRDIPNNVFYPYLVMGAVSEAQLPQVLIAGGTRTDVNDLMITKAILSSYMDGFKDIVEYAIDARSAMKSIFYNAFGMPNSQYTNRKMQLQASVMRYVYEGDCGSQVTVPFHITKDHARNVVGKIIKLPSGELCELTDANVHSFVGQTVQLRSVFTCRHTDGFCRVCGGRLTDAMHPGIVPGFASVIELMGPVAQLILSNKHVAKTTSESYRVPESLIHWMRARRNEVYLRPRVMKNLGMRIPFDNMPRIRDVQHIVDERAVNDQQFSAISSLQFFDTATGELLTGELFTINVPPGRDRKKAIAYPYFSAHVLRYLRDRPDAVTITDKTIDINFTAFDVNEPLFRCIVANDSMIRFCQRVERMFTTEIRDFTSIPEVLRSFTNQVWSKVSPNLLHIEVALRANLVTSGVNYQIPVVEDVNNVRFDSLGRVIPMRSIGGEFAFEQIGAYLSHPLTYTIPRPTGCFDAYLGFRD